MSAAEPEIPTDQVALCGSPLKEQDGRHEREKPQSDEGRAESPNCSREMFDRRDPLFIPSILREVPAPHQGFVRMLGPVQYGAALLDCQPGPMLDPDSTIERGVQLFGEVGSVLLLLWATILSC